MIIYDRYDRGRPTKQKEHNMATHLVLKKYYNLGFDDMKVIACELLRPTALNDLP